MFGDGNPFFRHCRACGLSAAPITVRRREMRTRESIRRLTGREFRCGREVLLPAGVRRNGGDDRFRRGGRAHQIRRFLYFHFLDGWRSFIRLRVIGSGAVAGWRSWACSTLPVPRWFTPWVAGPPWPASSFLVRVSGNMQRWEGFAYSRPQYGLGHARCLCAVVWLVWFQSWQYDGCGCWSYWANRGGDQHGGSARRRSRRRLRHGCCR